MDSVVDMSKLEEPKQENDNEVSDSAVSIGEISKSQMIELLLEEGQDQGWMAEDYLVTEFVSL